MASRKDELNAYTYARRRTVAAFLQPAPSGSEEGAPRPLRAVVPGLVVAVLVLVGFGAWGMFRPAVPDGWDEPGAHVVIGAESTTRYVVLSTDGEDQLHPVLNLASARLVLDSDSPDIVQVDEEHLDGGTLPHGPAIGIPYAPDRLPSADEAGTAKHWAVCEQPGETGARQAVLVLAEREADLVAGDHQLAAGEMLYVTSETDGAHYLVDADGTRYLIGGEHWESTPQEELGLLHRSLVGDAAQAQPVTEEWLATLHDGSAVTFPEVPGTPGERAGVDGLDPRADRVGTVLLAPTGGGPQHYVVVPGQVLPVSDFTARLLLDSPAALPLDQGGAPMETGAQAFTPAPPEESLDADRDWPADTARLVSDDTPDEPRTTVCSVLRDVDAADGATRLTTWAGPDYPATIVPGATSAYVTPGSGLLFRQVQGEQAETGGVFLLTDTGLRYGVHSVDEETDEDARVRLGYGDVEPVPVPAHWSEFLATGPRLDTESARQPQGS